jgi:thioredoxin 1
MNKENFESQTMEEKLVVVDFFANWCRACLGLMPSIERIADEKSVKLLKVNVDESTDLASSLGIKGIPAIILFKDGQEVERIVGAKPPQEYSAAIERHLN